MYIPDWPIGLMVSVFAKSSGGWGSIPGQVMPKLKNGI